MLYSKQIQTFHTLLPRQRYVNHTPQNINKMYKYKYCTSFVSDKLQIKIINHRVQSEIY